MVLGRGVCAALAAEAANRSEAETVNPVSRYFIGSNRVVLMMMRVSGLSACVHQAIIWAGVFWQRLSSVARPEPRLLAPCSAAGSFGTPKPWLVFTAR